MANREPASLDGGDELRALTQLLEQRAERYYPELETDRWHAVLMADRHRPSARLYFYALTSEGGHRRLVVVKMSERCGLVRSGSDRPRLFPVGDPPAEPVLEFDALRAIEDAVRRTGDPQLGWVRALDLLADMGAVVLEHVGDPTLTSVLRSRAWHRRTHTIERLGPVFEKVGAWLRVYRELAAPGDGRRTTVDDVSRAVHGYVEYLARYGVRADLLRELPRSFDARAHRSLPGELRLGAAHTDLSPRNVFVGSDGSVRVIDTLGYWQVPWLEDPAYFLTSVQTAGIQLMSRGWAGWWAGSEALGDRFLRGAGIREPAQVDALSTYRVLLLLDKWTALVERSRPAGSRRRRDDAFLSATIARYLDAPLRA